MKNSSVIQDWACGISFKKQTVMIGAVRAPDTVFTLRLKQIVIWIRATFLKDADPMTGFMHKALQKMPLFEHVDREWERLPLHAAHHLLLALQVIGWEHPTQDIRNTAITFYNEAVYAEHLNIETKIQYEDHYKDNMTRLDDLS